MNFKAHIAAIVVALAPVAASSATVDINFQAFGAKAGSADIAGAIAARDAFIGSTAVVGSESFDGFTACDGSNGGSCTSGVVDTSVGQFSGLAPSINSGGSQVAPKDKIVVRSNTPNPFNRFDVVGTDGNWLDSNDMNGISWDIPGATGISNISKIAFFLTDVDDVGNVRFDISANNAGGIDNNITNAPFGRLADGNLLLVTMLFSAPVDALNIQMISGTNDGFGFDGGTVAAVPLPAAGFLLVGALGGLAALRRRRKAA